MTSPPVLFFWLTANRPAEKGTRATRKGPATQRFGPDWYVPTRANGEKARGLRRTISVVRVSIGLL